METNNPWILKAPGDSFNPASKLRLFCFPQAGSGAWVYHGWEKQLPSDVEVMPVELPGRNTRTKDPKLTDMTSLVDAIIPAILPYLDRPFVLFGNSMGAWVAYALTQELANRGLPLPLQIFVAANRSPKLAGPKNDVDPVQMHKLPAAEFWKNMERRYGPNPNLEDPVVKKFVLPILQADFQVVETYQPLQTSQPLSCGIIALGGTKDGRYTKKQIEAWKECAPEGRFDIKWFDGGHNFTTTNKDELLPFLAEELRHVLDQQEPHEAPKAPSISSSMWSDAGATVGSYLSEQQTATSSLAKGGLGSGNWASASMNAASSPTSAGQQQQNPSLQGNDPDAAVEPVVMKRDDTRSESSELSRDRDWLRADDEPEGWWCCRR